MQIQKTSRPNFLLHKNSKYWDYIEGNDSKKVLDII